MYGVTHDKPSKPTYWGERGKYQDLYERLWKKLVPASGEAATAHGEILRMSARLYYDIYNNGLCNDKRDEVKHLIENFHLFKDYFVMQQDITDALDLLKELNNILESNHEPTDCYYCDGQGWVDGDYEDQDDTCMDCNGSGQEEGDCVVWNEKRTDTLDNLVDAIVCYVGKVEENVKWI